MDAVQVLTLPSWQGSGAGHWQSVWEAAHGYQRVEQHDWMRPLRGDWSARLDEVIADAKLPVVLAAHSLGCILAAWWGAHSNHIGKVRGALLVAPGDVSQSDLAAQIPGWLPIVNQPLPFPSIVVGSRDDPYCAVERAQWLAQQWGARWVDAGAAGHLNAESDLGDWPAGHALLTSLMKDKP